MSRSEFRYNKKRKHYEYLFKYVGAHRKNIIISSKPMRKHHKKYRKNIKLIRHPNKNSKKAAYLIPIIYIDDINSFDYKILNWDFDKNDKRKVKRIKKRKKI